MLAREGEENEEQRARAAKAACEASVEQLECELRLKQLRREDSEAAEARRQLWRDHEEQKKREREERVAREETVRTWRAEQAQQRNERRKTRQDRWKSFWDNRRKREESIQGQSGTLRVLTALGTPAVLALLIYALTQKDAAEVIGVGLLTAASAFAVGALLGFLFGIPRSIAPSPAVVAQGEAEGKGAAREAVAAQHFVANTNLEQISDWLTKILVGVGLIQIHELSSAIDDLANGIAGGLGSRGFAVAVALLVSFSITGFVGAYLFTRLRLQKAFELAVALKQVAEAKAETAAIALVQQQLTPGPDKPTLEALTQGLKEATQEARTQAFFLARRQRRENWSDEGSEEERREFGGLSIPVFQALIACDTEKQYYRSRAELAYALLEKKPPRFAEAKTKLDEAIDLRPDYLLERTPLYELNRAYATIELDRDWKAKAPSSAATVDEVCRDLEAVIQSLGKVEEEKHKTIKAWLKRNAKAATGPDKPRLEKLLKRFRAVPTT